MRNFTNKKGIILISAYLVIVVLVVLSAGLCARSIGEERAANKDRDLIQALWLAEAGLDRAMVELPNTPLSGSLGMGRYSTVTTVLSSTRYLINAKGGVPADDESNSNNSIKKVSAIIDRPVILAHPGDVTAAITANGHITVKGSSEVNGDVDEFADFSFEYLFGISKQTFRNRADHLYTDPPTSVTPVDGLTWVDLVSEDEMGITENGWSGSGILVVDGDLRITGGHFEGIIWVIGRLWVSGNPVIDGAIYVESGVEVDTTLVGNPTVNYDTDAINDAFGNLPTAGEPSLISWKED